MTIRTFYAIRIAKTAKYRLDYKKDSDFLDTNLPGSMNDQKRSEIKDY